jgi:hypothetical protein
MKRLLMYLGILFLLTSTSTSQKSSVSFDKSFPDRVARINNGAFPYDSAGIVAYTQIPADSVNIQKGVEAFTQLDEVGENYAIGTVEGQKLYFDKDGWVISYFPLGYEPARLIRSYDENILTNTNLSVPIFSTLNKMIKNTAIYPIYYSDLEHQNGDSLLVFWSDPDAYVHFEIPSNYNVINQSASVFADVNASLLYVDGGGRVDLDGNLLVRRVGAGGHVYGTVTTFVTTTLGEAHTLYFYRVGSNPYGAFESHFSYLILFSN